MISVVNTTGEERIWSCKVHHEVTNRNTVPSQYTGTLHRLQAGIQYPDGTQEHCTGCEQEVERGVEVSLQLIKCKRGEHL